MSFDAATIIDQNRRTLLRLLAGLFVMAGIVPGGAAVDRLPRSVRAAILFVLRPAESAVRRLAAARAREMDVDDIAPGEKRDKERSTAKSTSKSNRSVGFPMFDSLPDSEQKRRQKPAIEPRILDFDEPFVAQTVSPQSEPEPDDMIDSTALCGRLQALQKVLENLEGRARRFARELARRRHPLSRRKKRVTGLRPDAPGYRKKWAHLVDEILWDCVALERRMAQARSAPDTS